MTPTYVSVGQAARILDQPYYHVHRLIKKNQIKAKKMGWAWLILRSDVLALKKKRDSKFMKKK